MSKASNPYTKSVEYLVELEPGVWLAQGEGDPPRTLVKDHAHVFECSVHAAKALSMARSWRPFKRGRVFVEPLNAISA